MPNIKNTESGTVFQPTANEIIQNNRNKQQRRQHQQLIKDVEVLKSEVSELKKYMDILSKNKNKSIRKSRGKY